MNSENIISYFDSVIKSVENAQNLDEYINSRPILRIWKIYSNPGDSKEEVIKALKITRDLILLS